MSPVHYTASGRPLLGPQCQQRMHARRPGMKFLRPASLICAPSSFVGGFHATETSRRPVAPNLRFVDAIARRAPAWRYDDNLRARRLLSAGGDRTWWTSKDGSL